jgi:3-methyladenine DNA glycosylase AlkD
MIASLLSELESLGKESNRRIFAKHGAPANLYGVSVADLQVIRKRLKKQYALALDLYATGNSDAMYLAGLIADEQQMTREDLQRWCEEASWYMISEFAVPWVAAESRDGLELAQEWIRSDREHIAAAGWATLSSLLGIVTPNAPVSELIFNLLQEVKATIHQAPNRVRHTMNGFVIAAGASSAEFTPVALEVAAAIGKVSVDMGGTACKVPDAADYIRKIEAKGGIGKKKKMARC